MNIENMDTVQLIYLVTFIVSTFIAMAAVIRGMFDKSLIGRTFSGAIWAVFLGLAFGAIGKPIALLASKTDLDFFLLNLLQIENFRVLCGIIVGFILGFTLYIYTILKFLWECFWKITLWPIKLGVGLITVCLIAYIVINYFM